MPKELDATLREHAEAQATESYREALHGHPAVEIEQVVGTEPAADVLRFWAVRIKPGTYRAAVLYAYPGRNNVLYCGIDGGRLDVITWLTKHGVPTVRLGRLLAE